ncbi:MAG: Sec-independent protein translocase protein TatB [Pseudomonadota bacterium]
MPLLPQFGFFELIMIAVIALVVVGPQDLPKLMRSAGQAMAQVRRLAAEFAAAFDQMARETEMEEMRKEIEALKKDNVFTEAKNAVDEAVRPISDAVRNEAAEVKDAINKPVVTESEGTNDAPAPDPQTDNTPDPVSAETTSIKSDAANG